MSDCDWDLRWSIATHMRWDSCERFYKDSHEVNLDNWMNEIMMKCTTLRSEWTWEIETWAINHWKWIVKDVRKLLLTHKRNYKEKIENER